MAIEAIKGPGVQRANLVCDTCSRSEVIACSYDKLGFRAWQPSRGQALTKAKAKGWAEIKGDLVCPACEAKRKAIHNSGEKPMTEKTTATVTDIRKPTGKQKRLITLALEDAYDDAAKRYKGQATDKTIADELGDGIMFGWVAEIREECFGPSGENEEIAAIRREIALVKGDFEEKMKAISKRLDVVVAAVGPRAQRAV